MPRVVVSKALRIYKERPRIATTAKIQLGTGKLGLNYFLFTRKVLGFDLLLYDYGEDDETVEHFLYKYP